MATKDTIARLVIGGAVLAATTVFLIPVLAYFELYDVTKEFGPVSAWFRDWEGEYHVDKAGEQFEVEISPEEGETSVLVMVVEGRCTGYATVEVVGLSNKIHLPKELGTLQTMDCYDAPVKIKYVPNSVTDGDLTIKWLFG